MPRGYLSFVLHAHLPFVRHPEYAHFLEENWLFEAISETYLPLLRRFFALKEEGIPFRITLSVSPTLASMLNDELLQKRYVGHLEKQLELASKELLRTRDDEQFRPVVRMYKELLDQNYQDFTVLYKNNILRGIRELEKSGHIELITTAATHAFLPLFEEYPEAVEAQIHTAVINHGRLFGTAPKGFWLPECGYYPGVERIIKQYNLNYSIASPHGILFSDTKSPYGIYAPMECRNGLPLFGRDIPSSRAVWSEEEGYPGDFAYREFYRDIGFDLPMDYIRPYIHDDDIRVYTGFKYYAITGKTDKKRPYDPGVAAAKAQDHAENFLYNRVKQADKLSRFMDRPPVIVCPYDAELFGHWWFEGPQWLESLIRLMAESGDGLEMLTPSDYLEVYPDNPRGEPTFSSWGNKGYAEVWIDGSNDWIYRHVHKAIERMKDLVKRYPAESGLKLRVLNQAAREVLLSQASDWPFIIKTGTTIPYAEKRIKEHLYNFNRIYDNLCRNTVDTEWVTGIEKKNNVFPDIDYRIFKENG
ncbi:glycoside hydrolase [Marispirochaeta aestuarii]|uniref:Glycoside hydrolase n=1 Tax=Marispirochaeta aestuarii TaxID=1963862 RepID=A0A1Y1RW44_9SPIO|nr:1,4-alpha-glucan branching protein domain-containing protein [Marispirochaeta aestuarii]ORC34299.1 glycoside hydrolase [Marispirochaeta aestuarii]